MKCYLKRVVSILLVLTLCFACVPAASAAENYERIYGSNRYGTAFAVADKLKTSFGVDKFANIVVACGNDYADALSGSYLANKKGAPILLVNKNNLKALDEAVSYIVKNLADGGTVYILGGTDAVPGELEGKLNGVHFERLAGSGRYDTNLRILKAAGVESGKPILICTGNDYADALSASATGLPILLVNKNLNKLRDDQKAFLAGLSGNKLYIIGGTGAVSENIAKEAEAYGSCTRLAGSGRYETTVLIAKEFFQNPTGAVLAYGHNFPDGLCGGALAYSMHAPIILTRDKTSSYAVAYAKENSIASGIVLGGEGLISNETCIEIFAGSSHTHSYTEQVTRPTCESKGYTTYTCSCGHSYTGDETPATGHNWGDWYVVNGYIGLQMRGCTNGCGTNQERTADKLPSGSNNSDTGYYWEQRPLGPTKVYHNCASQGHVEGDGTTIKMATCCTNSIVEVTCKVIGCGATWTVERDDAGTVGHVMSDADRAKITRGDDFYEMNCICGLAVRRTTRDETIVAFNDHAAEKQYNYCGEIRWEYAGHWHEHPDGAYVCVKCGQSIAFRSSCRNEDNCKYD